MRSTAVEQARHYTECSQIHSTMQINPTSYSECSNLLHYSSRACLVTLLFALVIQPASAENLGQAAGSVITESGKAALAASPGPSFLSWAIRFAFALATSLLGLKVSISNEIATSSILAFVSALGASISVDQSSWRFWEAFCTGVSLGASIWLGRLTISRSNSILVVCFRYIVPLAIFWQILCSSQMRGVDRLDLSASIPCLSVFGAVGINAFVNEKWRELKDFLISPVQSLLEYLEPERARREEMV